MGKIIFEDYPSTKTPLNASNLNAMQDELINLIYPIGSIFMSVNSTNPSTYLGGTWEQLKDRFLLGAGDDYNAGSTGGEATHTLTIEEMPSHNHDVMRNDGAQINLAWGTTDNHTGYINTMGENIMPQGMSTTYTGENKPLNNMPPYLTVYMWERVE